MESSSGTYLIRIDNQEVACIDENKVYSIEESGFFTWKVISKEGRYNEKEFDDPDDVPVYYHVIDLYSYSSGSDEVYCPHSAVELRGVRETTATEDGIRAWFCVDCDEKLSEEYLSSYSFFLESIIWQIENAEEGATIEISSEIWHSLSQEVMLALAARRDITVVFTLRYEHEDYRIEIPAGTKIDTQDKYYGPIYLGRLYGMTKLEK